MNKLIILVFGILLIGLSAFGQETTVSKEIVTSDATAKKCVPTKECAEKMGMTLAECKAKCAKVCGGKATGSQTSVAAASAEAILETSATLEECASKMEMTLEECAASMGMTVEECRAKCTGMLGAKSSEGETTQVAAASAVAEVETTATSAKKTCAKAGKKCCSKKN